MTATDAPHGAGPDRTPPHALTLSHIMAVVMLNSIGFNGVRVLNTLYALELGVTPFTVGLLLFGRARRRSP